MLNRRWFIAIISLLIGSPVNAMPETCETKQVITKILQKIDEIKSYDVKITSTYEHMKSSSLVSGVMPDKMYLKQILYTPRGEARTITVFDGNYQWVDIRSDDKRQIYKIKLNKVTKPGRPFDTSFNIYGTGLLSGEDYSGTLVNLLSFYDLTASCSKEHILLSGPIDKNLFKQYVIKKRKSSSGSIDQFIGLFGFINIEVDSKSNMVNGYSMGPSRLKMKLDAIFQVNSINQSDR